MFWRSIHSFLIWVWPAIFAGAIAIGGLAVTASQVWPEARIATGRSFSRIIDALGLPETWFIFIFFILLWLSVFIYSQNRISKESVETVLVPDLPLHMVFRYLAQESKWASDLSPQHDDQWIIRTDRELVSALHLGRVIAFGEYWPHGENPQRHYSRIPPDFFMHAQWDSSKVVTDNVPCHFWRDNRHGGGLYNYVKFNRSQIEKVWPRRSLIDKIRKNSPVDRWIKSTDGLAKRVLVDQDRIYRAILASRR